MVQLENEHTNGWGTGCPTVIFVTFEAGRYRWAEGALFFQWTCIMKVTLTETAPLDDFERPQSMVFDGILEHMVFRL